MRCRLLVPVILCAASVGVAQPNPTHISPAGAATGQGNVNNTIPFSQTSIAYQQIHTLASFNTSTLSVWNRMSFRAKAGTMAGTADMEIYLSECPNDSLNGSGTFASNITPGTETNVFTRKMANLPSVSPNVWGAGDFLFDAPFLFKGTANISWRMIIWSNTVPSNPPGYVLDCYSDWRNGPSSPYTGCQHPLATQKSSHNCTYRSPGNTWEFNGYTWVANTAIPGFLLIGTSPFQWGNVALPFDLTPLGAPGCQIVNDAAIAVPVVTTNLYASGFVQVVATLPNNPTLIGGAIYSQYAFVEKGANQLGLFTSNGRINSPIPAPNGVARIYAIGNPSATAGTWGPEFGVPVGFQL